MAISPSYKGDRSGLSENANSAFPLRGRVAPKACREALTDKAELGVRNGAHHFTDAFE